MKLRANGIAIEAEDAGDPSRPVVVLIMGLGMQLIAWPETFVHGLMAAGFRVVTFDNRDIGLSQHFDELGVPNLMWESFKHRVGLPVRSPYSLADMAADTVGVLDALGIAKAHVIGVSMGGMIAQRVAIGWPDRVLSLASIMSSSGAKHLPGPRPRVLQTLLSRPLHDTEEGWLDHYVRLFEAIGSPGFTTEKSQLRERLLRAMRRNVHPAGAMRQIAAVAADTRRARELERIQTPTLVMHGVDDPLVPVACGDDTARRIPNARFISIHGMGHDLAPGVVDRLLAGLVPHLRAADE